jgi:hypothetical protein
VENWEPPGNSFNDTELQKTLLSIFLLLAKTLPKEWSGVATVGYVGQLFLVNRVAKKQRLGATERTSSGLKISSKRWPGKIGGRNNLAPQGLTKADMKAVLWSASLTNTKCIPC